MLSVLSFCFFLAVLTECLVNSPNLLLVSACSGLVQSHPIEMCGGCLGSRGEHEGPQQWHVIADIPQRRGSRR